MTAALLIAALMLGAGVAMFAAINLFLVLTAPDDDMLREVDEEAEALDVWGRLTDAYYDQAWHDALLDDLGLLDHDQPTITSHRDYRRNRGKK